MKQVVLTGGPCSGKTTVQRAVCAEFCDQVMLVPEAATMLLESGFPVPGEHLPWSEAWQAAFQAAILPMQLALEDSHGQIARERGCRLLVCDRGILDGAAYAAGDSGEFCRLHGLNEAEVLARYEAVIHLESLALTEPEKYGKAGNAIRFETLERAQRLEATTRSAWARHPRHRVIGGRRGLEAKVADVLGIIRSLLAEI